MKKMDYKLWVSVVALALGLSGCIITENGTNDVVVSEDNASSIQQPSSSISASSSETVSSAIDIPISSGVDVSSAVAMSSDGVLSSAVPTSSSVGILGSSSSVVVPVGGIHGIVINEAGAPLSNVSVQLEGPAVGGGCTGGVIDTIGIDEITLKPIVIETPMLCYARGLSLMLYDTTDGQGNFSFEGVADNSYSVYFTPSDKYVMENATVEVKNGKSEYLTQVLKSAPILTYCSTDLGCGSGEYCQASYDSQGLVGVCLARYEGFCRNNLECGQAGYCAIYAIATPAVLGLPAILPPQTIQANGKCIQI